MEPQTLAPCLVGLGSKAGSWGLSGVHMPVLELMPLYWQKGRYLFSNNSLLFQESKLSGTSARDPGPWFWAHPTRYPNWPNSGGLAFQNSSHKVLVTPLLVPNERTRPAGWLEPVSGLVVAAGLPWGLTSLLFLLQNTDLFEMIEKMQVRMGQGAPEQAGPLPASSL